MNWNLLQPDTLAMVVNDMREAEGKAWTKSKDVESLLHALDALVDSVGKTDADRLLAWAAGAWERGR
jgi:hypothetical protein